MGQAHRAPARLRGLPDGSDGTMTYIDGKRCFIDTIIRGLNGPRALKPMPRDLPPNVAGGDAITDVSMVRDAVGVQAIGACRPADTLDGRRATPAR